MAAGLLCLEEGLRRFLLISIIDMCQDVYGKVY
jgi:hypothetical protein